MLRGGVSRLAPLIVVALAIFVGGVGSAAGAEIHVVKESFGGGELSVESTSGIALDTGTNTLYVADTGDDRVMSYTAAGAPLGSLGAFSTPTFLAVDNSPGGDGDLYVVEAGGAEDEISKVTASGALLTSWAAAGRLGGVGQVAGIAVDASGRLWVFNTDGQLRSYSPGFVSGEAPQSDCTLENEFGGSVRGIAVDDHGRIYLSRRGGQFRVVNAMCESQANELVSGEGPAVDPSDGSVFLTENRLEHFRIAGGRMEVIEAKIGKSVTGEGISDEEGEGTAEAGQLVVDPAGRLFAVVPVRSKIFEFGLENVEPPSLEDPLVSEVTGTSARFMAHINPHRPPGANALPYAVEYEFRCTPGCPGGEGTEPGDATNHLVEFEATGLEPGATYKVELIARNAGGRVTAPDGSTSPVEFTTGAVAPSVGKTSIIRVSESEAAIEAVINPGGAQTAYQVEYATLAQFEVSGFEGALRTAPGILPAGGRDELVQVTITGLLPGTRYKARAVAANAIETDVDGAPVELRTQETALLAASCTNAAFQAGVGAFLPDCRAYEQATPADKNGGSAAGLVRFVQASESGAAISYYSQAGFPGGVGGQDFPTFVANRGSTSWATSGALPPQAQGERAGVIGLTRDDRHSLAQVRSGDKVALVYRDLTTNEVRVIVPYRPDCSREACFAYAGSNLEGTKVFFESYLPVTKAPVEPPATEPEAQNLYMWNAQAGQVVLVGENAFNEPLPEGSIGGPYEWVEGQTATGGAFGNYYTGAIHAISDDGDQAVFTEAGTGQLFARIGLEGSSPSTIHVSRSQNPAEVEEHPAAFLEATADGEFIFFKAFGKLTPTAGAEGPLSWNLYRYNVSTGELLDLTPESIDETPEFGPEVQGLVGASSDGQVAYFVALGKLAPGAAPEGENLYRFDATASPTITLVATLESAVAETGDATVWDPRSTTSRGYSKTGRVSESGDAVIFGSEKPLTGYDNHGAQCGTSSERCTEFYRWSTATETPECLTCDATGAVPLGSASLASPIFNAVFPPVLGPAPTLTRNLSAEGTRFFFQTPDPLSARDTNANHGCAFEGVVATCQDVYEWEAAGTGSCRAALVAGGCINLLSSGGSEEASYFGDADRDGNNAFVFTSSPLVPVDRDKLYDIYDVMVNGGLASQWEERVRPCTSAESCGGQRAEPGAGATAGSETFVGPGNPKPKPPKKSCRKGAKKCKKKTCHKGAKQCPKKHRHHQKKHHPKHTHGGRSAYAHTEDRGGEK